MNGGCHHRQDSGDAEASGITHPTSPVLCLCKGFSSRSTMQREFDPPPKIFFPPSLQSYNSELATATNWGSTINRWPHFSANDGVSHTSLNLCNLHFDLLCWVGVLLNPEMKGSAIEDVQDLLGFRMAVWRA